MDAVHGRGRWTLIAPAVAAASCALLLWFLFREVTDEEKQAVEEEARRHIRVGNRPMFVPSHEWKEVTDDMVCPPGLEYRMDLSGSGGKWARLPQS
mmetsp:Transcript_54195/g.129107  ORF Transcript_54195/g.129107 Transcript_54195/m.129107 type:complete len:96 (+) Transcript_54195:121-408(+)